MPSLDDVIQSTQLPTLPTVAIRLLELTRDPETEITQIVECVKSDPAISTKLLKSANSSFFGFRSNIRSIERAVPLMGTTVVTSLALSFSLTNESMNSGPLTSHYRDFWQQSIIQAVGCEAMARFSDPTLGPEFLLAGLLTDIGRLAMLKTIPRDYFPVLETCRDQTVELFELETQILGFSHCDVGNEIIKRWKLPEELHEGMRLQHAELEFLLGIEAFESEELTKAILLGTTLGDYMCSSSQGLARQRMLALAYQFYGMSVTQVDELIEQVRDRIEAAGQLFAINMNSIPETQELLYAANQQLVELTMKAQVASTEMAALQQRVEQQQRELETRNQELQQLAQQDSLTGAYNRKFFENAVAREVATCCDLGKTIAFIFVDVDKFKSINDTYGHQFGDTVLKQIARILQSSIRSTEVLARYGGEEFVILVGDTTEKGLEKMAERLRAAIERHEFFFRGERVQVTASFGAAIGLPERDESSIGETLISAADAAMYQSKRNGRNQVHLQNLIPEFEARLLKRANQKRFSRWIVARGVLQVEDVLKAQLQTLFTRESIGLLATEEGVLTSSQVEECNRMAEESGKRFGRVGIEMDLLTEELLAYLLAIQIEPPHLIAASMVKLSMLSQSTVDSLIKDYYHQERDALLRALA